MIAVALAVYHEARRMTRSRALGPSWNPCRSGGDPYNGRCVTCAWHMEQAVAWLLAEDAERRAERERR